MLRATEEDIAISAWLSAALSDERSCAEFKEAVNTWFESKVWPAPSDIEGVEFVEPCTYGDLETMESWLENVEYGGFVDYDGHGVLSIGTKDTVHHIWPSMITIEGYKPPAWATHVRWFNR